jgi:hypothetical protein
MTQGMQVQNNLLVRTVALTCVHPPQASKYTGCLSVLMKSHYIIISCNKILKCTLEVQTWLKHLCDKLQLAGSFWKLYPATQHIALTVPRHSALIKCLTVSFCMPKCHFIYAQKKSRAFSDFPKPANTKQCCVHLTVYWILPKLDSKHGRWL